MSVATGLTEASRLFLNKIIHSPLSCLISTRKGLSVIS